MKRDLWTLNFLWAENYSAANVGYFPCKLEKSRIQSLDESFPDSRTDSLIKEMTTICPAGF